ncbi:hypothetical protein [Flexivirga caeni]|uniref:Uncharacterized protein n=1 Tax=Flexivirga caeni TaxID=2294115 RepID=A0A3M9M0E1_9MICO|nr:hypothetical protein [Flexivirga caeni]RNI19020.1 hypothetical protein EFY87_17350 [Flexivirga caeni]
MTIRTDLPYLRARSLRAAQPAPPAPAVSPSPDLADVAGSVAEQPSASLDLSAPVVPSPAQPPSASLDLSAPSAPAAPAVSASLDLGDSAPPTPPAGTPPAGTSLTLFDETPATPPGGTSLSLDAPSQAPAAPSRSPHGHTRTADHGLGLPTINAGERRPMTENEPVVELTRMQSAAGGLDAKVAVSNPSEVILGLVFETGDSRESLVLPGLSQQGPDPRRPIFRATTSGVAVNLRRITDIHRLVLFAVPTRPSKQLPGGTVTVTTYGESRLEIPLVAGPTLGAQALLTGYVVEGRLVLRAEHDPYSGTLQQICAAYGYREISWRDPYTPLV